MYLYIFLILLTFVFFICTLFCVYELFYTLHPAVFYDINMITADDRHQDIVIKLLYHLSYDEEAQPYFVYTDCVSLVSKFISIRH